MSGEGMTGMSKFQLKVLADLVVLAVRIGLQKKIEGEIRVNADLKLRVNDWRVV